MFVSQFSVPFVTG